MSLAVWKTGLQSGEWVTGISNTKANSNIGTTFQIKFANDELLRPSKEWYVPNDLQIRDNVAGYLKTLTPAEREQWLIENSSSAEHYISDFDDAEVRFSSLGGAFLKLDPEYQLKLNSGEWLTMKEVFNMFPRKPGSKAKRHTLIFRGSIWSVIDKSEDVEEVDIYFDLITCEYSGNQTRNRLCVITTDGSGPYSNGKTKIGLCDNEPMDGFFECTLEEKLKWFTPGILKSLIQKCIRANPKMIKIDEEEYENSEVLLNAFLLLLKNPGSFVPDLRAFVKGSESAFKRLAVSIIEDSSINNSVNVISSLFFAALAARKDWIFSEEYITRCCEWCIESLNMNCYEYDFNPKGKDINTENKCLCDAIETLGSFESDINMIKSCCDNKWKTNKGKYKQLDSLDIWHCFDHHCVTDIVYLMETEEQLTPKQIINIIWEESSKFNPRKHNYTLNQKVKDAQRYYWLLKTKIPETEELECEEKEYQRLIDESWISGMIGPIEHKINGSSLTSFFHPENISSIVTIRSASRAKDQKELTEEELALSSEYISAKMSKVFKLKEDSISVNTEFRFVDDRFLMKCLEQWIEWKDYCEGLIEVKESEQIDPLQDFEFNEIIEVISSLQLDCVLSNWQNAIVSYLENTDKAIIFRISMYLRTISDEIAPYKVSRDGTGTYQSVNWTDAHVFKFLCLCCFLIPAAIQIKRDKSISISFEIRNIFIWNALRKIIFDYIGNLASSDDSKWKDRIRDAFISKKKEFHEDWSISDLDDRVMKDHQLEAVDQIMSRIQFGKRGNIIWIPVGGGKTFICINVLFRSIQRASLPKYVVYALPPSAYESVLNEFKKSGLPTCLLDSTQAGKKKGLNVLREYHINFIKHDHLREMKDHLIDNALDIFLILDEFHLMMNVETQRTSVALELSKLANNFIALTGTLIKDKDPKGIIEWISQVVDFKLTEKNYMVGVASLISAKINYGIEEVRHFIEAEIPEENEYYSLVDKKLGGSAERTDFKSAVKCCYEITKESILNVALQVLDEEPNVFVIALNKEMQEWLSNKFEEQGYKTFKITGNNSINMTPGTHEDIKVVITTMQHSAGYNLTAIKTMIQGVYFSNQATRTQLIGRLIRMGQLSSEVDIITVHCGILSYTLKHYEDTRSLEKALGDLAKEI